MVVVSEKYNFTTTVKPKNEWRMPSSRKKKRCFAVMTIFTLLLIIFQLNEARKVSTPRYIRPIDRIPSFNGWTWDCHERHCERRESEDHSNRTSLNTCRMTCGTTRIIWPKPTGLTDIGKENTKFDLENINYNFDNVNKTLEILMRDAYDIFVNNLQKLALQDYIISGFDNDDYPIKIQLNVSIIGDNEKYLTLDTDEYYELSIREKEGTAIVIILAKTFYGARNALETLTQLTWWDDDTYRILNNVDIVDEPRFKHRGIMIDTARHFVPLAALKRTVDGMAASKLNVLHLHLTDSQSFAYRSKKYPQMATHGAYSSEKTYSGLDLVNLAEYARVRGVRLLPEVDVPGHAGNGWQWGEKAALGNLTVCYEQEPWQEYCGQPPCGQLNPNNKYVYVILQGLFRELVEATGPTDLFHLGGDEINVNCWLNSIEIFPNQDNLTYFDFEEKLQEFTNKTYEALEAANGEKTVQTAIVWSNKAMENLENIQKLYPPSKYIIQQWGASDWESSKIFIKLSYRTIISHFDAWYLDCGYGPWMTGSTGGCPPVNTWQMVYMHRPWQGFDKNETHLVLGGEACLWTEQADENSLDAKLWPRSAALAERLWSDPVLEPGDVDKEAILKDATLRLALHRERLVMRGLKADVMWPEWCDVNPEKCFDFRPADYGV